MKRLTIASCVLALFLLGCNRMDPDAGSISAGQPVTDPSGDPSAADPAPPPPPPEPPALPEPADFVAAVSHSYFPLVPGTTWSFVGQEDGIPRREELSVLVDPRPILGVSCTAVEERIFVKGEVSEMTTHFYAQDRQGNVWRFGEESVEFLRGVPVPTEDSWVAGEDGALPWIVLAADPQVGDLYVGSRPDGGTDVAEVLALGVPETVAAGAFAGCMEVEESNPDDPEDTDRIIYAPGVGPVSENSASGRIELVSFGVR